MPQGKPAPKQPSAADAKKIHQAKMAYARFLRDLHALSEEQKTILDKEVKNLENKKIEEIQHFIQSMDI
ncbi:MAG: hypothetical protein ACD_43C00086G0002 [uncultured bacterium]|nr:MAG: hypothetical protein ACD_43C00086G0002 [uncultured bacterium]